MGYVWNKLYANFGGNRSRDTGFLAKTLESQSEVQIAPASKLFAGE